MRRLVIAAVALGVLSCGGSDSSTGVPAKPTNSTTDVYTIGDAFSPFSLSIIAGDTVRWNFSGGSDGTGHNVRFTPKVSGAPSDINVLKTGQASRVFPVAGDYKYVCDVHPGMIGEVVVY